jgi:HSP20 family molecular chaperone IbpA
MASTNDIFRSIADVLRAIDQTVHNIERIPTQLMEQNLQATANMRKTKQHRAVVPPIVYGYSISVNTLDGKPIVEQFGNVVRPSSPSPSSSPSTTKGNNNQPIIMDERKPLTDITYSKDIFKVTAEMPGIAKDQIKTRIHKNQLEISANGNAPKKYYQRIDLPQDVNTDTLKSNYVNGILEIEFGKKQKLEEDSLPPAVAKKNKNQKKMSKNRRQKARAK